MTASHANGSETERLDEYPAWSLKHFDIINIGRVDTIRQSMARYERERRKAMLRKRSTSGGLALASRDLLKAVAAATRSHDMVTFEHLFKVADDTVERRVRPRRPE